MRIGSLILLPFILTWVVFCKKPNSSPDYSQCRFDYNPAQVKLQWTAYKFTERLGVSGTFNAIQANKTQVAAKPEEVFAQAEFSIDAASVNTNNPDRDKKIYSAFFAAMKDKGAITARVESVSDKAGVIALKMNGVEQRVNATVRRVNGKSLEVSFSLDLANFNALSPLAALNLACKDLHKGKDGKSKLWPEIDVKITATLNPICPG